MEEHTLTTPESRASYRVCTMNMHLQQAGESSMVMIELKDNLGNDFRHTYAGQTAEDFIKFLNTANLSVKSLHKRILERLTTDGVIPPGTVTGAPDA